MLDSFQSREVRAGRLVELPCIASGYPNPAIRWLKDGRPLPADGRWAKRITGLSIADLRVEDSGTYICEVTNTFGSAEVTGTLTVIGECWRGELPPARLCGTVKLSILARLTTQCVRCGARSVLGEFVMLLQQICSRPLIYRFNRDLWKQQCNTMGCKLLDGNVLRGASVLCFADLHKISSSQTVNTIWAGQIFTACCAPGGSCSHQQHPGCPGTSPLGTVPSQSHVPTAAPALTPIKQHKGRQGCHPWHCACRLVIPEIERRRRHPLPSISNVSPALTFSRTDPLRVTLTPKKLKTGIGSTVILSCALSGSPEYVIRWYRNTDLVVVDDFISIRGISNETLLITAAQKSHSGAYQCFATRKSQTAQDFSIITLEGELASSGRGLVVAFSLTLSELPHPWMLYARTGGSECQRGGHPAFHKASSRLFCDNGIEITGCWSRARHPLSQGRTGHRGTGASVRVTAAVP